MPKYHVTVYTETDWASTELKADDPRHALFEAYELELSALNFQRYESASDVERLEIHDENDDIVAAWRSPDLCCRLAAPDLLKAAEALVDQIKGLHGESSVIDQDIEQGECFAALRAAIAKAKTGQS